MKIKLGITTDFLWNHPTIARIGNITMVIGSILLGLSAIGLGTRGCNNLWNNRETKKSNYEMHSFATGLTGHIEFIKYSDGSYDIKEYPSLGHRYFDSEFHQDLDGDGKIDRIRKHGAEWKMNRLDELLTREQDYQKNKERFDEADKQLRKLINKYPSH